MPIPSLLPNGLLPPGLHEATLQEVARIFGSSNERRQRLQRGLEEVARAARSTDLFTDIIVDGSFVTNAELPGDVDVVLRTRGEYWSAVIPLERDPEGKWLTDHDEVKQRLGVQLFIEDAAGTMPDFFALLKPEEALERGVSPTTQRGLIRVAL